MSELRFGLCVPLFANPGRAFFRTPAWPDLDPPAAVDAAVTAEELGFDSVWVADHLMHGHDGGILEGWTTLCVIAGRTRRVQLGTIHLAQPFRAPAILAKMASTLDALSGGRLILFYDCGWNETEVRAYGLPWPEEGERIARMEEGLRLIDALWTAEAPLDFRGEYFRTEGAICRPRPVLRDGRSPGGGPPVWLGEARDARWVDAVCRHADGWNSAPASPARLEEKLSRVREGCARAGRDPRSLTLSLESHVLLAPTEAETRDLARRITQLPPSPRGRQRNDLVAYADGSDSRPLREVAPDVLGGSPEAVVEQVREYAAMGVRHFMLWFLDFPALDGMRLFAQQVLPALR